MGLDAGIIIALIALVGSIFSAFFVYKASSKATSVEMKKVDQQAFDRAVEFYQKQLDDANKQLDRVSTQSDRLGIQLEKVMTQLASEQDISNSLRNQVRALQTQVNALNETIAELRVKVPTRLDANGVK